jgi:hypothetical protein
MSLNISDEGYNNGKKYGQKGTICGPNNSINFSYDLRLGNMIVLHIKITHFNSVTSVIITSVVSVAS